MTQTNSDPSPHGVEVYSILLDGPLVTETRRGPKGPGDLLRSSERKVIAREPKIKRKRKKEGSAPAKNSLTLHSLFYRDFQCRHASFTEAIFADSVLIFAFTCLQQYINVLPGSE